MIPSEMSAKSASKVIKTAQIIVVASEVLDGARADQNVKTIAEALRSSGFRLVKTEIIRDELKTIVAALRDRGRGLTLITGGLGSTRDDLCRPAIAEALRVSLIEDKRFRTHLLGKLKRKGIRETGRYRTFYSVPRGALRIANRAGLADGFLMPGARPIIALPGVPIETETICRTTIAPVLRKLSGSILNRMIEIGVMGLRESEIEDRLLDINSVRNGHLSILPRGGLVYLRTGDKKLASIIKLRLLENIFTLRGELIEEAVLKSLKKSGETVAVAESCTGGMVSERLTSIPGSSAAYMGGVIAYSNEVKKIALGVPPIRIATHGAASKEVAIRMAHGVRRQLRSDWAISVTGIAGPGGGTVRKPVGTVFAAVHGRGISRAVRLRLSGTREQVRRRSADEALVLILRTLRAT